jgi:hypothetical protein
MQRHPRATAATGIGYLVLTTAGLILAPILDLGSSDSAVRDYLGTPATTATVAGGYSQLAGVVLLLAFVVQLSAPGTATVGRLAAAGATFTLACVGTALAVVGGIELHRMTVEPRTAAVLMDMASLLTWISTIGLAVAVGALGSVILTSRELPGWMAWSAFGIAAGFAVGLPLVRTPIGHVPAALFDLWVLVAAVILLVRSLRGHDVSEQVPRHTGAAVTPYA